MNPSLKMSEINIFIIKIIDQKFKNNEVGKFFHRRKIDHYFKIQNLLNADSMIQIICVIYGYEKKI